MKNFFAILGGMGTPSTTNFLEEMNRLYAPPTDQDYLDYVLFNHSSIPDRTEYLLGKSSKNPADSLLEDIEQLEKMKPDFIVMACNTAHCFYDQLQGATTIPIVNMPALVTEALKEHPEYQKVGLAATEGTVKAGLYTEIVKAAGADLVCPSPSLQAEVTRLIYEEVKGKGQPALDLYHRILREFQEQGADVVILGCTELSFSNNYDKEKPYPIVDAEGLLLQETIRLGCQSQHKPLSR